MLQTLLDLSRQLSWPLALVLAWLAGELLRRGVGLPRISAYGLVGFALGPAQLGVVPSAQEGLVGLMANVAFGLILFEFGYRINLRWYLKQPWIAVTGLAETGLSFMAAYGLATGFGLPTWTALPLAILASSSSPAALLRVVNEHRSSGQVTERALHLTAVNVLLTVFAFKACVGVRTYQDSGDLLQALLNSGVVLASSVALGVLFGWCVPALLRRLGRLHQDVTVGFALGVLLLATLAHTFMLSPILATLTFGMVARHRQVVLTPTQRNFGVLGDLLAVGLFMVVASTIAWPRVWSGLGLALLLILVRAAVKTGTIGLLSRPGGTTLRKGLLTGLAMTPISVFVILILEQTRLLGVDLVEELAPLAAMTLILEIVGPWVSQQALRWAHERSDGPEA